METKMKKLLFPFAILIFSFFFGVTLAQARFTFVSIGTGGITGVYYPTGGAIAKMVNRKKKNHNIHAVVESTGGSVFNLNAILAGTLQFGIVQSDTQFMASNGLGEWKDKGAQLALRSVFSLYPESVTLIAASDAGIKSIHDLKGKHVNLGNLGSGHRQNAIDALTAVGIDYTKDLQADSIRALDAPGMLQEHRIDAFFYTVGHPSGAIKEATSGARKVVIAEITGINSLLESSPYYTRMTIPIKLYPGAENVKDVQTFGAKATLVTSASVSDEIVYTVTKEIFENLESFKKMHPAFSTLTKENMLTGLSAPIHPGAMKYYKEAGLK
jgi:TRAP transporter TAXI family solute receptor